MQMPTIGKALLEKKKKRVELRKDYYRILRGGPVYCWNGACHDQYIQASLAE
jgi:hypothetical protein